MATPRNVPAEIPAAARAVLESAALAHLVTIAPDGSPQVTVVWVGIDGTDIVFATLRRTVKIDNLMRDPRVAVSLETDRTNEVGLREYLVVHGRAHVTEGGAPELLQHLARTYIGPDARFPPMPDPPPGYVVRISVDRLGGVGPW